MLATLAVLGGGCGSATTSPVGRAERASALTPAPESNRYGSTEPVAGRRGAPARQAAARVATASYRADVGDDAAAFVAAVDRLHADLVAGDPLTARADELDAQSAYDGFRMLETGNTVIASTLDERASDVGPGRPLAGLHAVERDLWGGSTDQTQAQAVAQALADTSGLVAQAPVAQYLLSRDALGPEAIGTTAVAELGWVDDVAVPDDEELYSHLDAVDIAATVGAAQSAFSAVQPLARVVSPALTAAVATSFTVLAAQVTALGHPDQRPDDTIPMTALRSLAQQVDATAAALARLSALLAPYGTSGVGS